MKTKSASSFLKLSPFKLALAGALLFGVLQFPLPLPAAAGAAPGVLKCKSLGRTGSVITLAGEIPGDYEVFDLKIKKGKAEFALKDLSTLDRDMDPEEMTKLEDEGVLAKDRVITVVKDFERGVFAMALRSAGNYDLRLYALPQTVRARVSPNSEKASFDAMLLEGRIPGESDNYPNRRAIRMRCTYDHSI
ncbi:MAG: hypothetical protein ACRD9R_21890 [Pyrinomonadaceae bacterium]